MRERHTLGVNNGLIHDQKRGEHCIPINIPVLFAAGVPWCDIDRVPISNANIAPAEVCMPSFKHQAANVDNL